MSGRAESVGPNVQDYGKAGGALASRRMWLDPVGVEHHDYLYALATHPAIGPRWRFHGRVVSRDEFVSGLWNGVDAQFVAPGLPGLVRRKRPMLFVAVNLHST